MDDRREHARLEKVYRLEYGPFSSVVNHEDMKTGAVKNLSGGGILFAADEKFSLGAQLFLKIYISGWSQDDGEFVQVSNAESELLLMTLAEVLRVDDESSGEYLTGARFIGQVHR